MLRKFLNLTVSLSEKGKPLYRLRPLVNAIDTFFYEAPLNTRGAPHIRDSVDLKRWMTIVMIALLPCILVSIWNTGIQKLVYTSSNFSLMEEFLAASQSFGAYKNFAFKEGRYLTILYYGLTAFLPVVFVSYAVGGFWEVLFACIRRHDVAEGFFVTGILYPLILPPTIPYWMVAVGVSAGVIISKELFGGTGMNILNPALVCRAFLYFGFPSKMSGDVWVGTNPTLVRESLATMNQNVNGIDGYTQATMLAKYNIHEEVRRIHIDAIATNTVGRDVETIDVIERQFSHWNSLSGHEATLGQLTPEQMQSFITSPLTDGGLGLSPDSYSAAYDFCQLQHGVGHHSDANLFFGNQLGSFGETSVLACLIGAIVLIYTGVGAWRRMVAIGLGAFITAWLFQFLAHAIGIDSGAWNPAKYALPAYKHLLLGGLAFGLVFMATDPVTGPVMKSAAWVYGIFIGTVTIIIRAINPAYPEGIMLAILLGNVFAPLFEYYAVLRYRGSGRATT